MNFTKAISALLLIFALTLATSAGAADLGTASTTDTFSSPQVNLAPNGDRTSHYPPYFHPEE